MKNTLLLLTLIISTLTYAQDSLITTIIDTTSPKKEKYNPLAKPNTYQNTDNPNYWKNKMPNKAYWQQDVYYNIQAKIDEETDIITAIEELTYTNNSPDELNIVYFHLYQNAFQPDSYLDELQSQNKKNPKYGEYESKKLGTIIDEITIDGMILDTELDNTILKVYLPSTLKTGMSITFKIKFKTYFDDGDVRRRMAIFNSWGYKHYNGVHWYPRICVYDAKFGWTKDQHLGKEFYGNFGTFDVELDFASNFVVEATGFLLNRKEVLPKELRKKLDITNFKDKEWNSTPSIITPYKKGERKVWKFHAENVHDFAFTADPTYRIGEAKWKDKVCYSLVQEPHASKWQNAAEFGAECLKVFSEDFGMYVYHKVIVADARSGMEYPMITLDGGSDPGYRDLLAHEIGHMWFFGQVGNNETYRALLDEGFTQFLTAWAMIKIDGEYVIEDLENTWKQKFKKPTKAIDEEIYYSYINDATKFNDPVISTHSDGFHGALRHGGGYRHVYYKTAAMLYNLQYVLGDKLFLDAMKHYFNTWKIAHPYNEDFRNTIIQYTKVDLNWFFDQWLESTKRIDYSVKVKNNIVTFKRKSRMQMPIDFRVIANNGKTYEYHIPNNWFIKKTNAIVLPKWHGWDLIHPEYSTTIDVPSGIAEVIIDPTNRLADAYMPDNSSKHNTTVSFNPQLWEYADWKNYEFKYSPDIWWNNYDGMKIGMNLSGGYMNHHHLIDAKFWLNTGALQKDSMVHPNDYDNYSYLLDYNTNLDKITLNSRLKIRSQFIAGLYTNNISIEKSDKKGNNQLKIKLLSLYRTNSEYLINKNWDLKKMNNRIDINLQHKYKYPYGNGTLNLALQSSALGSHYDYNTLSFSAKNNNNIEKLKISTRAFFQIGTGSNWAEESKLGLAGANNEEMMNSKFTRADGLITSEYMNYDYTTNYFHSGGGLNLRGYNGYLAPEFNKDNSIAAFNYNGTSGAAFNTEIDFTSYLPFSIRKNNITSYLFADAGIITSENLTKENYKEAFSDLRTDAGIGFTYTFRNFGSLETIKPLIIRFDMPLFLNRPPASDDDFVQMRWIIGINRAF
ncbi:MAG: M1 family aminopeptidase [Bacteroidota bacterium]|nr:M1 family aminopeptidase [Bacteroidota bacterium]